MHVAWEIAVVAVLYLPCEHSEHGAEPLTSLYEPALHSVHTQPLGPVKPLLQVQFKIALLPWPEKECGGHSVQVISQISPVPVEYVPSEHSEHGDDPFEPL